ncbi:MAG: trypsin-like serine protease [Phycisphaera sp.]|nr:trypsin-like serine protease [Phycisphaera sp.]
MTRKQAIHRATRVVLVGLTLSTLWSGSASAISIRGDVPAQDYFDLAAPFTAVGRIYTNGTIGSGTLVSSTQFLTAAHVVDSNHDGIVDKTLNNYSIRFGTNVNSPSYSITSIASISIAPNYGSSNGSSSYDLAILTFSSPFLSISPIGLSTKNPLNKVGTMVGYGLNGTGTPPFENNLDGLRRAATNTLDVAGSTIRSDFDSPALNTNTYGSATPLALEGTTAAGDSGGPLVVDFGQGNQIVGVLSGGYNSFGAYSEYGDISVWAPIMTASNAAYLLSQGVPIPEPTSIVLLALGCVLCAHRRHKALSQ